MFFMKRLLITSLAISFSLQLLSDVSFAGSGKRIGTAGALELLIPVGSRGAALNGANQASSSGLDAIYWNPAGIARSPAQTSEVMFSRLNYIADIDLTYLAAMVRFQGFGVLAFSLRNLDFGDISVTTEEQTDGTGEFFSPTYITAGLSFSKIMTDRVAFGITGKFISESIMRESAQGFALDIGVQYTSGKGGYRLGVALKNLGPNMKFDGPDLEEKHQPTNTEPETGPEPRRIVIQSFELPSTLELGVGYEFLLGEQNSLSLSGDFVNNNFSIDEIKIGTEYSLNDIIFIRGGYNIGLRSDPTNRETFTDSNNNGVWDVGENFVDENRNGLWDEGESTFTAGSESYLWGLSIGAGLRYDVSPEMTLSFDYAYQTVEIFDNNQWLTLTISF